MDHRLLLRRGFVKLNPSTIAISSVKCRKRTASIRPWRDPGKMSKSRIDPGKSNALEIYDIKVIDSEISITSLLSLP